MQEYIRRIHTAAMRVMAVLWSPKRAAYAMDFMQRMGRIIDMTEAEAELMQDEDIAQRAKSEGDDIVQEVLVTVISALLEAIANNRPPGSYQLTEEQLLISLAIGWFHGKLKELTNEHPLPEAKRALRTDVRGWVPGAPEPLHQLLETALVRVHDGHSPYDTEDEAERDVLVQLAIGLFAANWAQENDKPSRLM